MQRLANARKPFILSDSEKTNRRQIDRVLTLHAPVEIFRESEQVVNSSENKRMEEKRLVKIEN